MRILLVAAMFPPIRTGTSYYSKNLAESLQRAGHKVTVVSASNTDVQTEEPGLTIHRLAALQINLKNYFKHLRITAFFPQNYLRLVRLVKQERPDVILLVNHYLDIAFPAIVASKLSGVPLVVSVGTQLQSLNPLRNKILRFLDYIICGFLVFPHARKIISWDAEIERYINEVQCNRFANRSVIIPFGVNGDPEDYAAYDHSYELHRQIIGVGSVIGHRNYTFQVEVFKELLDRFPDLKLKIIGHIYNDEALNLARNYGIADRVEFMGEQPHEVVLSEMNRSDIHWMMLDGDYKGLGTANLEAMLLGLPIVSNIPDGLFGEGSLNDMEHFIRTDGRNKDAVLEKITLVLESRGARENIGRAGQSFVRENMNWPNVVSQFVSLFKSLKSPGETASRRP